MSESLSGSGESGPSSPWLQPFGRAVVLRLVLSSETQKGAMATVGLASVGKSQATSANLSFYYLLFFLSGFPALLYQIVWQRALFTLYGVNIESVTMIVTVFMLGLGLGSLAGGRLSQIWADNGEILFGWDDY